MDKELRRKLIGKRDWADVFGILLSGTITVVIIIAALTVSGILSTLLWIAVAVRAVDVIALMCGWRIVVLTNPEQDELRTLIPLLDTSRQF